MARSPSWSSPVVSFVSGAVFALLFFALTPGVAHAQIQKNGPEVWPGKNEISLHIGGQVGALGGYAVVNGAGMFDTAGGTPGGFRFGFDYGRLLLDQKKFSLWFDAGFNLALSPCNVVVGGPFNVYSCDGDEFRPFAGVKLKFRTPIPLVPYAKATVGIPIVFDRYCGDDGVGAVLGLGGGVKYFLTKRIGVGLESGFSVGPERYLGTLNNAGCDPGQWYVGHTETYFAFDFLAGAEFIF